MKSIHHEKSSIVRSKIVVITLLGLSTVASYLATMEKFHRYAASFSIIALVFMTLALTYAVAKISHIMSRTKLYIIVAAAVLAGILASFLVSPLSRI
ncbi:hypothetical protein [Arcanobacterium phocae]|uniref:hypothetical protein n=1 Tax=Arcanobacterium phocae TaxID=131112 RepID=UPI001C0EBBB6|nr:hypothetical protein [Arcanobacterium phocae]